MYNYAYLIGNAVKTGMDMNEEKGMRRRSDYQLMANISAAICNKGPIEVIDLWRRKAVNHQETHRIKSYLTEKFKDNAIAGGGGEWLRADPEVMDYFKNLHNLPEEGKDYLHAKIKQYHGEKVEII